MKNNFFDEGNPKWVGLYKFAVILAFLVSLIGGCALGSLYIVYRQAILGIAILLLDVPISLGLLAFNLLILNFLEIGQKKRNEICGRYYSSDNNSNELPELE